jgi:hypothetical protein
MNGILTFSFETLIIIFLVLGFTIIGIEIKYRFGKSLKILEFIYLFLVGGIISLISSLFAQSFLSGTGIYTRQGWPIAYIESGHWDLLKFGISILLYTILCYLIFFIYKRLVSRIRFIKHT